jgi:hypothetical protein
VTFFEHTVATPWIALAVVLALILGAASARRHLPVTPGNLGLGGLYLLMLGLLTWCLLLPGRKESLTHTVKPRFVIALDTSQSMTLRPPMGGADRWETARAVLELPWMQAVAAECDIEILPFGGDVGRAVALAGIPDLQPDADLTLLRDGLEEIAGRVTGLNVAGALLLSDGVDTREMFDDWAADPRPFPVYTVRLEPPGVWEEEPDLAVDAVSTPRRVSVDWTTECKVRVSGQGTRGSAVAVRLLRDDVMLQEKPVHIPEGGGESEVSFELEHSEIGRFQYRVMLPPLPGELNTNDNEYVVSIQVTDARNRLLYVEGIPRWEYKFLRRTLLAEREISPVIFYTGADGTPRGGIRRNAITADMTPSQLSFFKIVILGNLTAEELGEERARNLILFVEAGGSLVLLGGAKAWGDSGFTRTALREILPVRDPATKPRVRDEAFAVHLTDAARAHPAFAGDPELWQTIPPILSIFPAASLSAAAEALVTADTPSGTVPVVVTQRYGQGKVAAILTDTLWKWQLSPDALEHKPYARFWTQLLAWMVPREDELDPYSIDLLADREQLFLGEEIEIQARVGGTAKLEEGSMQCRMELPDEREVPYAMQAKQIVTLSGQSFSGFSLPFTAATPGLHTVTATGRIDGREVKSDPISFYVKPYTPETMPRPIHEQVLRDVAAGSNGQFFEDLESLNDALVALSPDVLEEVSGEFHTLWRNWPMLITLMAALTASWGSRKFRNMP